MKIFERIFGGRSNRPSDAEVERLDRRAFMVGMTVTAAGLLVPKPTLFIPHRRRSIISDDFTIDVLRREIRYVGPADGSKYTILELHEYLRDQWDDEEDSPSIMQTSHIIEVRDGWQLSDDTIQKLRGGSLSVGDDIYSDTIHYTRS